MHSKDKKTQIRLRAPGLPFSKTWCWLGRASAFRTPLPGGSAKKTCRTLCTISRPEEELGKLVFYSERISLFSPPISISPLTILQIKSACRNNCVQHGDRLLRLVSISGLALTLKKNKTKRRARSEVRDGGREGKRSRAQPACFCCE